MTNTKPPSPRLTAAEKLELLRQEKAAIEQKRKNKLQKLEDKIKTIESREAEKKDKIDTRKKILYGAMVLQKLQDGSWDRQKIDNLMDKFLTRSGDRKLFGFPTKDEQGDNNVGQGQAVSPPFGADNN